MAAAPPKPWERSGAVQATPDAPGAPKPWEQAGTSTSTALTATAAAQPSRPWEAGGGSALASTSYASPYSNSLTPYSGGAYGAGGGMYGSSMYGGAGGMYGSSAYSSPYSSMYSRPGMYGSSMYGGAGSMYGGGMYGSSMYGGAGGMYGGGMYGSSMYGGGGMYGGGMYGGGMYGGAPPGVDPSRPPAPPSAWQAALAAIGGVVHFFGRLSFLVDENAHAVSFFMSALLQMLDRAGSLYGELARFILRVIFRRKRPVKALPAPHHPPGAPGAPGMMGLPGPAGAPFGAPRSSGVPWQAPALPPPGAGSALDVPAGHWDSLWD